MNRQSLEIGIAIRLGALGLTFFGAASLLFAGGPRLVDSVSWDPRLPIRFKVDPGPLRTGSFAISNAEAVALVETSLKSWSDVESSSLLLELDGFLDADVTGSNYGSFLSPSSGDSPIIFDADASIIQDLTGGNSMVLGLANAFDTDGDGDQDWGFLVLRGTTATTFPTGSFARTIVHEVGHVFGLDHTQVGLDSGIFTSCANLGTFCDALPIMYPVNPGLEGGQRVTPGRDDAAWTSWLYPEPSLMEEYGWISGTVYRKSGVPFQGAHVVAAQLITSNGSAFESREQRASCVSDFLTGLDGSFEIPGLPPGDYVLFVEPISGTFVRGSGVGPFDERYTQFGKDYYNGEMESGEDDRTEKVVLQVSAGQGLEGIRFITNDLNDALPGSDLSTIGDDESRTLFFPEGFTFPFFGREYKGAYVNSDGNLTFLQSDSSSSPRSESRFLGGPPRIAPLFHDLDPSAGGTVSTAVDDNSVRIEWAGVGEFVPSGAAGTGGNAFSVTLFRNGDIRFDYQNVALTPDTDGVVAIVGITPGSGVSHVSRDFSNEPDTLTYLGAPVYELFRTPVDLVGRSLLFRAGAESPVFLFPFNRESVSEFTGFAVSNDSAEPAELTFESREKDGNLSLYPDNPHVEELPRGQQIARLGREFFGLPFGAPEDGWVRLLSDQSDLVSFFQFGRVAGGKVDRLDGAVAQSGQTSVLYFTRIYDGPAAIPSPTGFGPLDAVTTLSLANPNGSAARARLTYFGQTGFQVAQVERQIAGLGVLREGFSSLFPGAGPRNDGFVRVEVIEGEGLVGFELIETAHSIMGFNAALGNSNNVLYSAQLAHGVEGGVAIYTSLKLVNISGEPRAVTLTALAENGSTIFVFGPFILQDGQTFQRTVGEIFNLGPPTLPAVRGSIRVEASGAGVVGDVFFGDPDALDFAAALPLQTRLGSRIIFSQVANSVNPDPAQATFTGLAFHNPNTGPVVINIEVYGEGGELTGEGSLQLAAGERLSDVLTSLVPSTAGQVKGYIVISATSPIVAQQLFGNLTLDFLSAVPPVESR